MLEALLKELETMEANYHALVDPDRAIADKTRDVVKALAAEVLEMRAAANTPAEPTPVPIVETIIEHHPVADSGSDHEPAKPSKGKKK